MYVCRVIQRAGKLFRSALKITGNELVVSGIALFTPIFFYMYVCKLVCDNAIFNGLILLCSLQPRGFCSDRGYAADIQFLFSQGRLG